MNIPDDIDLSPEKMPRHVAVIMDGNGRWARAQGKSRSEGHRAGADALDHLMDTALGLDIAVISVYAFSTENWSRPASEVKALFALLEEYIDNRLDDINSRGIRVVHSGSMRRLPPGVRRKISRAVEKTAANRALTLNFCVNYGGRQEILDAVHDLYAKRLRQSAVKKGRLQVLSWRGLRRLLKPVSTDELDAHLYNRLPEPDLVIRTAGEHRLSNFLIWQIAYSEFWFTDKLWPEFCRDDLFAALRSFQSRKRKYGGL